MISRRTVPYDYECHRILTRQIPELNHENKDWPQYRFGTVLTSPAKYPNKELRIHYRLEFTSHQTAEFEFAFEHPRLKKEIKHAAEAKIGHFNGKPEWHFLCSIQKHKWCVKENTSLWVGKEAKLACQNCAHIQRLSKNIECKIIRYRKDPSLITYTLMSAGAKETQKRYALIALEKLSRKFKRMTKDYELLTISQKTYYKKLLILLFPPRKMRKAFMPSNKNDVPLPFQREY